MEKQLSENAAAVFTKDSNNAVSLTQVRQYIL